MKIVAFAVYGAGNNEELGMWNEELTKLANESADRAFCKPRNGSCSDFRNRKENHSTFNIPHSTLEKVVT